MTADVHSARSFQELLAAPDDQGPYVYSSIFSADTWRQRRLAKKKFKLLRRIDEDLRAMLAEGERVLFVTRGSMVSFWEGFFLGVVMYYLNSRAIVLTNRRMLLIQITPRGYPDDLREEIDYRAIDEVTTTLLGNTRIRFHTGTARVAAYVPKPDRQFLRDRIGRLSAALGGAKLMHEEVRHLCPHCFAPAALDTRRCEVCAGHCKSPRHAALLSLVFPGAGDFYLGHRGFATLEFLGAGVFWVGLLAVAWDPAGSPLQFAAFLAFILVFIHGVDAISTRHVARKGLYPAGGTGGAARRYALAALAPLVLLGASVAPLSGKRGLAPLARVLAGDSVPPTQAAALRAAGYLGPDETILRFYSSGVFSIMERGTLLSDRRVVVYGRDEQDVFFAEAAYEDIIDLQRDVQPDVADASVLVVARDDGAGFWFGLPTSDGQDLAFQEVLVERWQAARHRRAEGVWYDGGAGASSDDAIVVRGLAAGGDPVAAERAWLTLWLGQENVAWTWAGRERASAGGRAVDRIVVELPTRERRTYFFDVSEGR